MVSIAEGYHRLLRQQQQEADGIEDFDGGTIIDNEGEWVITLYDRQNRNYVGTLVDGSMTILKIFSEADYEAGQQRHRGELIERFQQTRVTKNIEERQWGARKIAEWVLIGGGVVIALAIAASSQQNKEKAHPQSMGKNR